MNRQIRLRKRVRDLCVQFGDSRLYDLRESLIPQGVGLLCVYGLRGRELRGGAQPCNVDTTVLDRIR